MENQEIRFDKKWCKTLIWITFVVDGLPLAFYSWARVLGFLPSEAEWQTRGGNHGPWWCEVSGDFIMLSILVMAALPVITMLLGCIKCVESKRHKLWALCQGLIFATLQFSIGFWMFLLIFWTID